MQATLDAAAMDEDTRKALRQFFFQSSAYVIGKEAAGPESEELGARWAEQRALDEAVAAIAGGHVEEALSLTPRFASRPSVFVGLLARMMRSRRDALIQFVVDAIESDPSLMMRRFSGRTLLHFASGAGCLDVVESLLRLGADPNAQDSSGHTPLYRVANECGSDAGPAIVRALVNAGGDVNAHGGVMRTTPLHMAARRGFTGIAQALLDCGAVAGAKDIKGATPLQRALNCRKKDVAQLLGERLYV
jgi:hypothetical protein